MKLSVITAVRNSFSAAGKAALDQCIDSIAKLPIEHEHIIQDGYSTDGTSEYLQSLELKGLRVFREKDNGIYDAINMGVERAIGDWIYVLGSDDFIHDHQAFVVALEQGEREKAGIVGSPVWTKTDWSTSLPCDLKRTLRTMPFPHQGVLMRRSAIDMLGGFNLRYKIAADYDLILRALLAGVKVSVFDRPYAYYSLQGVSTANPQSAQEYKEIVARLLGLNVNETMNLSVRGVAPLRIVSQKMFDVSPVVRRSARYFFWRWLANAFGMIGEDGALIMKGRRMRRTARVNYRF